MVRALLEVDGLPDEGRDRVLIDVLKLAEGDAGKVEHFVEVAKTDWRNIIYWAEYYDEAAAPSKADIQHIINSRDEGAV